MFLTVLSRSKGIVEEYRSERCPGQRAKMPAAAPAIRRSTFKLVRRTLLDRGSTAILHVRREEEMLTEVRNVRQIRGEGTRRWFTDPYFDLIVWFADGGSLLGFQLCYDKQGRERVFTWRKDHGCQHECIDAGDAPGQSRMSPVIVAEDSLPVDRVAELFLKESAHIDPEIACMVHGRVSSYRSRLKEAHPVV